MMVIVVVCNVDYEIVVSLFLFVVVDGSKLFILVLNGRELFIGFGSFVECLYNQGIDYFDVVVFNVGGSLVFRFVFEVKLDELLDDYEINVLVLLGLFQVCWLLLKKSDGLDLRCKKFIYVSSMMGSIGVQMMEYFLLIGYGVSKVVGNWFVVVIVLEYK